MSEITTFLRGGRGEPLLMIRDNGAWQAQVAAERRAGQDEEIRATVAEITRGEVERKHGRRAGRPELAAGMRANAALAREAREAPGRVAAELDVTEALVAGLAATLPAPPDREQARRDQDNRYSYGLAEWMAAHR